MAFVERWMEQGVCAVFPDLPWLADRSSVSRPAEARMRRACGSCVVRSRCRSFVARERICGGFWAGEFREAAWSRQSRPTWVDGAA